MTRFALLMVVTVFGCSEGKQTLAPIEKKPVLALSQVGPLAAELAIAGPVGLRAFQARVVYDASAIRLKAIAPGKAAARLDRVFSSDLAAAQGSVTVGLSDTRRVLLPARGALLRLELEPLAGASASVTHLSVEDPLGAFDGGKAQAIEPTGAEVRLP